LAVYLKKGHRYTNRALRAKLLGLGVPRALRAGPHAARRWVCAGLCGATIGALGCDLFDRDRRPYTPFPVASGAPEKPAPAPPPPVDPVASASPPPREALVAPARAVEWIVDERPLKAPEGLVFRLALVGAIKTGSTRDVLAWLVGTPERPVVGELWSYPEAGDPRLVLAAPSFLPTGPGCSHGARLSHAGPSSVTLDIKATCSGPLLPRAPERSVSVLAPQRGSPLIVGFRLAAPAHDERLDVEVNAADRDGDGRDDVEMSLRFGTTETADVRARFVWLQRAAGLSRDMSEPRASFLELAQLETVRASNQKASREVAEHVASALRLFGSSCAESGTPRIFMDDGAALDCGDMSAAFEAFTSAEIDAELNRGRVGAAFAALERHSWFSGGRGTRAFVDRQLGKLTPRAVRRRVIKLVALKAAPRAVEPAPHFSPLSFHADGSLLVLTADGLVRSAPDGRFEYEASEEIDGWSTLVTSPAGEQLAGVAFPCDRSDVVWLRSAGDGSPLEPLGTSLVAPRPGNCGPPARFVAPDIGPIAWVGAGPSGFIGATLVGEIPEHPPLGSAVSPNGRYGVVVTRWGLLVQSEDRSALWTFDDPALVSQLSDCVVSNNAQAAACLLAGRAHVILPDPKSG
jgi:hypothetical protein